MPKATIGGASNAWEEIKDEGVRILHSVIHPRGTEEAVMPPETAPDPVPEAETSMGDKFKDVVPEEIPAEPVAETVIDVPAKSTKGK